VVSLNCYFVFNLWSAAFLSKNRLILSTLRPTCILQLNQAYNIIFDHSRMTGRIDYDDGYVDILSYFKLGYIKSSQEFERMEYVA